MYLFLLLSIPLFYILYIQFKPNQRNLSHGFMVFFGTFLATIYCIIDFFVFYSYKEPVYNVFSIFPDYFITFTLIPFLVCGVFLFIFAKDPLAFKLEKFFPLLVGFFIIFFPYKTITQNRVFDYFLLFLSPLLYFSMLIFLDYIMNLTKDLLAKKLKTSSLAIIIPSLLVIFTLPAIIYSMYYTEQLTILGFFFYLVFVVSAILLHVFSAKIEKKFTR